METSERSKRREFQVKKLVVPGVVMLAFWGVAMWGWLASGYIQPLIMFGHKSMFSPYDKGTSNSLIAVARS